MKGTNGFFNTNTALEIKLFAVGAEYRKFEQLDNLLIIKHLIC